MMMSQKKSKMADGRHFEIGFFSKAQPRIMRFRWNLVCRWTVWFGDLACKQFCNDSFSSPQRVKLCRSHFIHILP